MGIVQSTDDYETFLRAELGEEVVESGLIEKRDEMASDAFRFLRATYWRWAETIPSIAPDLGSAPAVLAVGDIHLENFGTWRDAEGRLVWGVNDHDEAAEMPYPYDLLRLATSALLAIPAAGGPDATTIAESILEGYRAGLDNPRPFILDQEFAWLRRAVIVPEDERRDFWDKLEKKRKKFREQPEKKRPPLWPRYKGALDLALPERSREPEYWYRAAGLGSLGRPRWVARADWRGGWVVREAKAIVPSAWTRSDTRGSRAIRCVEIATGRFRAPDPCFRFADGIAVRRLSPNNRKLGASTEQPEPVPDDAGPSEGKLDLPLLLSPRMLEAMGKELAAVHLGTRDDASDIARDLDRREHAWLARAAAAAENAVRAEQRAFQRSWAGKT